MVTWVVSHLGLLRKKSAWIFLVIQRHAFCRGRVARCPTVLALWLCPASGLLLGRPHKVLTSKASLGPSEWSKGLLSETLLWLVAGIKGAAVAKNIIHNLEANGSCQSRVAHGNCLLQSRIDSSHHFTRPYILVPRHCFPKCQELSSILVYSFWAISLWLWSPLQSPKTFLLCYGRPCFSGRKIPCSLSSLTGPSCYLLPSPEGQPFPAILKRGREDLGGRLLPNQSFVPCFCAYFQVSPFLPHENSLLRCMSPGNHLWPPSHTVLQALPWPWMANHPIA